MTFMVSAVTNYVEINWADKVKSEDDENNDLEDALDIIRGKSKKRKISFTEKKFNKNDETIPMSVINKKDSDIRSRIINHEELDEWEDATESFETILDNTIKINNALKILQFNINILKEGYYKNYKSENGETIQPNSLDSTLEKTLKIIEESCKTIRSISIGEDDETERLESHTTDDNEDDNNSRKAVFGNEDEQTLIIHSREPTENR